MGSLSKCFQNLEIFDNNMYGDLMHGCTSSRCSNQVLDSLMYPYSLEKHMAIKVEKDSSYMLMMGTFKPSHGNSSIDTTFFHGENWRKGIYHF